MMELVTLGDAQRLLATRVTYYVQALDPTTPRTIDQIVNNYEQDNEPRHPALLSRLSWLHPEDYKPANAVASHVRNGRGDPSHVHMPCLDIDGPVTDGHLFIVRATLDTYCGVTVEDDEMVVLPSSTEGHHHLYVQHAVGEVGYMHALMALAVADVIEPNYALVSIRRRASFLRLPWVSKLEAKEAPSADDPF